MATLAIDARHLTKRYGAERGIDDVTLRVEQGARFGFLGPNGAGKTTFIRLALGLLHPQDGSLSVLGHDIRTDRMRALAEVGYLPGELGLYASLTGRRTLDVLGSLHPRPAVARAELCDLLDMTEADLRRKVRQYSRGMKQKLGLIAALQHLPPLAILDEPSGGLDPLIQLRLIDWLRERSEQGMTVFFSSHVLAEVEALCDRVAMVREGRLLMVRGIDELGIGRIRSVDVRFASAVDPERYRATGVQDVRVSDDGRTHRFTLSSPPGSLIAALDRLDVEDLVISRMSLEDAVRVHYDGPPPT